MMSIIRGLVKAVRNAKSKGLPRFDASGRTEEEFTDREMFQHFGVQSRPPEGSQCLLLRSGQNIYMIASDGGKYKIDLAEGEVAIYDATGNVIHLQNSGKILIESKTEVKVTSQKAIINSGDIILGPEALAALAGGVVTTMCSCAISGALHPVGSSQVKATL